MNKPTTSLEERLVHMDKQVRQLWVDICSLAPERADLINEYIEQGNSQAQTARLLGITPSRVRQIRRAHDSQ